jgi:mRNA interferase MazF
MISTTLYKPGDVILVRIKFTDSEQTKKRPAVILTDDNYHNSRADTIVIAVSSQLSNTYFGDYEIEYWQEAGLPQPSKVKGVIHTIDRATIEDNIGKLTNHDYDKLKDCVRDILNL